MTILSLAMLSLLVVDTRPTLCSGWSHWENLGGVLNSGPTAASHAANRIDVFVRGIDDALWHVSWDGRRWSRWESLGGVLNSDPDCVSWGPNRIDCFARGIDGALRHIFWEGNGWSEWESLGGELTSGPSAASSRKYAKPYSPNRLDVFARGKDNAMWHIFLDGDVWSGWENFSGEWTSDPDCVSWSLGRVDCFVRGADGSLWRKYWGGSGWSAWGNLGGTPTSGPSAASWGVNRLDVFVRGTDNAMWHMAWNGTTWSGWENVGGVLNSDPDCVSWGDGRIDCFVRGADDALWHAYWPGSASPPPLATMPPLTLPPSLLPPKSAPTQPPSLPVTPPPSAHPNRPPHADFGYSEITDEGVGTLSFDAYLSSDPDGDWLTYRWDFGDGLEGEGIRLDHRYQKAGRYDVSLTVSDGELSDTARMTVTISEEGMSENGGKTLMFGAVGVMILLSFAGGLILLKRKRGTKWH